MPKNKGILQNMKIGVWLSQKYTSPNEGGGASYYDILINAIDNHNFGDINVAFISNKNQIPLLKKDVVRIPALMFVITKYVKKILFLLPRGFSGYLTELVEALITSRLLKNDVKIIFYPTQGEAVLENFPFITNNWDIGHKATFAFPELIRKRSFEIRDDWYSRQIFKALLIFCESESGKNEVIRYTGISSDKIRVVPTFAGRAIDKSEHEDLQNKILNKFGLKKNEYFFYPAQFWAHKNHYGLIKAFKILTEKQNRQKLMLTGSDKGCCGHIRKMVKEFGLDDKVVFGGFVTIRELTVLYKNASALLMATFFGPTNMPLLEALSLDCPVLCTDISGHKEIMNDGALYFDPMNYEEIANRMEEILRLENRKNLLALAHKVRLSSKFKIENSIIKIDEFFNEAIRLRNCWE